MIRVGYKPIDDHCAESTLGGGVASMVNQFRREKLREYFEVKKLCEERGLPLSTKTLDRGNYSTYMYIWVMWVKLLTQNW